MSVHVITWVLEHSEATLGDRLVLLVLADHAKKDGTSAWPSLETIAHEARLSERQARRCLRNLEESGDIVETGRSRKGTHIYAFPRYISQGDNMTPLEVDMGGTSVPEGGDMMTPEPSLEQPSVDQPLATPSQRESKSRKPNPVWDALAYIFGEPTTRSATKVRGKVAASITLAGGTGEEVVARAKRWPAHFPSATMTDLALEKHWHTLARKPLRRTG